MKDSKGELELSIVIPCLNESKTLPIVIAKSLASIKRLNVRGEVVVADNGSTDDSVAIAEKAGARVVHCPDKGYGNALRCGFTNAKGKFLIMGDADDSYNFSEIDDLVTYLREGYDLVIGTRLKGRIEKGAMPFLHRYVGTPILTRVLNILFGTRITDCNCGMRGIKKSVIEKMALESPGMEFASEMIIRAGVMKIAIKEIPITLYKDKRDVAPHLHTWRDGWRHLKYMLLFSPTYLFMMPGLFLFLLGTLFMLPAFGVVLGFSSEVIYFHRTLLGSLLIIVGYQLINIGVYAKAISYVRYVELQEYLPFIVRFYRLFNLEKGFVTGVVIAVIGVAIDVMIFVEWSQSGFGALNKAGELSVASTFIIIGVQTIFSSFFLSLLNINYRKAQPYT